jgi:hypothetical protein
MTLRLLDALRLRDLLLPKSNDQRIRAHDSPPARRR